MQKNRKIYSFGLIICVVLFALSGCSGAASATASVGALSAAPVNQAQQGTRDLATEQNAGYKQAEAVKDNLLKLNYVLENDPQTDLQVLVRKLVQDAKNPVVAIVGATSNEATMQAAGLVNFFNVPMLVPTADGNTLFPSNNLWAFRLSAPSSSYAKYFFNTVLNKSNLGSTGTDINSLTGLSVAILYEQNTFGEAAAVATANAAMAQEIKIAEYRNFPATNPSTDLLTTIATAVKAQHPSLVYIIASQPDTAGSLIKTLRANYATDDSIMPIIVGQAGTFTSEAFLSSADAQDIYILRQHWNKDRCPTELTTFYSAQSYAATYLLNYAMGLTTESLPANKNWLSQTSSADDLKKLRETLRDKLKETYLNVPCLGNVAFDNTGQNKLLEFEILTVKDGNVSVVSTADFVQVLIKKLEEMNASFD